ncbi:TatD family hydrolase [Neobacillus mesonae]|nr:TatD family hydrolase [Neobacillus mesonae]
MQQPEYHLAPVIDSHIHLDQYDDEKQPLRLSFAQHHVESVIAVSTNLASCLRTEKLASAAAGQIFPAYGFHPEQPVPSESELRELLQWMEEHLARMIAVGEVGLPYYSRQEAADKGNPFELQPYIDLLDTFIGFAKKHDKPIILHAVYEDADIAVDLLEHHRFTKAHFHWFKGAESTVRRMAKNGYFISFTPDIVYEKEIQDLAGIYPHDQVMAETDGPWPFEGPFAAQKTHPRMVKDVISAWCDVTGVKLETAAELFYNNTKRFYGI